MNIYIVIGALVAISMGIWVYTLQRRINKLEGNSHPRSPHDIRVGGGIRH